jgi:hypothetical protein
MKMNKQHAQKTIREWSFSLMIIGTEKRIVARDDATLPAGAQRQRCKEVPGNV